MATKSITPKTYAALEKALSDFVCAVPPEFTEAVAAEWAARSKRALADKALEAAMDAPNRTLRKFLQRYLDLRAGEWIDVYRQQWYVNYDKSSNGGREIVRPSIRFRLCISPGIEIRVDCHPHDSCESNETKVMVLLRTLRRVRAMVEAARGE